MAVRIHVGMRRKVNEDAFLSRPEVGLWAVADGMGGHEAGDVASGLIVESLGDVATDVDPLAQAAAVRSVLDAVNARLRAMAAEGPGPRTIGSTVVALAADTRSYVCLWVGDSRAYRARGGGLVQLTRDHSLVQQLIEAGEISPAEAGAHPSGNIITRAVGAADELRVDSVAGDVAPGDAFILASDGLTRVLDDAELLVALQAPDIEAAAGTLLESCLARGAPDNVAFVMVRSTGG